VTIKAQPSKRSKKVRVSLIETDRRGLVYKPGQPDEIRWDYPLFIGHMTIPTLSKDPLKVEFLKDGKFFYLIFYDKKYGMVARARLKRQDANYILRALISKKGHVPAGGLIDTETLNKILRVNPMESWA